MCNHLADLRCKLSSSKKLHYFFRPTCSVAFQTTVGLLLSRSKGLNYFGSRTCETSSCIDLPVLQPYVVEMTRNLPVAFARLCQWGTSSFSALASHFLLQFWYYRYYSSAPPHSQWHLRTVLRNWDQGYQPWKVRHIKTHFGVFDIQRVGDVQLSNQSPFYPDFLFGEGCKWHPEVAEPEAQSRLFQGCIFISVVEYTPSV